MHEEVSMHIIFWLPYKAVVLKRPSNFIKHLKEISDQKDMYRKQKINEFIESHQMFKLNHREKKLETETKPQENWYTLSGEIPKYPRSIPRKTIEKKKM